MDEQRRNNFFVPGMTMPVEEFTHDVQRNYIGAQFGVRPEPTEPNVPEGMKLVKAEDLDRYQRTDEMLKDPKKLENLTRSLVPGLFNQPAVNTQPEQVVTPQQTPNFNQPQAHQNEGMPSLPNADEPNNQNDFLSNFMNDVQPGGNQPNAATQPVAPQEVNPFAVNPNQQQTNNIQQPVQPNPQQTFEAQVRQAMDANRQGLTAELTRRGLPAESYINLINGWGVNELVDIAVAYQNAVSGNQTPQQTRTPSLAEIPGTTNQNPTSLLGLGKRDPNSFNI